jgi:RHS repeat-associated protein
MGAKLREKDITCSGTTRTDYCGNVIYESGTPTIMLTDNGYVTLSDNKYHFCYKDHEGNNRVVADQSNTIEQVNNYYPFGLSYKNDASTSGNKYKYNGKELQTQQGLDWYDYGARFYDPELCQWHAIDPLCEKYYDVSPYVYCAGNPVNIIDTNGKVIDTSGLTEKEKKEYEDETSMIKRYSELFKAMYSVLENTKDIIEIRFGNTIERPNDKSHNMVEGEFTANGKNGTVTFLSGNQPSSPVLIEELFHAYQHENTSNYSKGNFNFEFEAKTATTAIGNEYGGGHIEYGGMKTYQGIIDFTDFNNKRISIKSFKKI